MFLLSYKRIKRLKAMLCCVVWWCVKIMIRLVSAVLLLLVRLVMMIGWYWYLVGLVAGLRN